MSQMLFDWMQITTLVHHHYRKNWILSFLWMKEVLWANHILAPISRSSGDSTQVLATAAFASDCALFSRKILQDMSSTQIYSNLEQQIILSDCYASTACWPSAAKHSYVYGTRIPANVPHA